MVPAAGRGERLGAGVPKALVPVRGRALLTYAVDGLLSSGVVSDVVVAAPPAELAEVAAAVAEFGADVQVVAGGAERTDSVRLALDVALAADPDAEIVLVHDAARAFTPLAVIRAVVAEVAAGAAAVVPVLPVSDTIKQVDANGQVTGTVDRSVLRVVQTPQGFAVDVLRRAYAAGAGLATDDAGLVERLGESVHTVPGHPHALKITTPFDLAIAEAVLAARAGAAREVTTRDGV